MSQGATKMHQKIDLIFGKGREKVAKKVAGRKFSPDHFGSHFPLKNDEKIDAKIDAKKVMKNHEKTMQKRYDFGLEIFEKLIVCEKCLMQNNI